MTPSRMTRVLTTALGGYDIHWWHVAIALVVAGLGVAALYFGGRWAWPRVRAWSHGQQALAGIAAIALVAGAAYAIYKALDRPGDVLNTDAAFHRKKEPKRKPKPKTVNWPVYGYDDARTRFLPSNRVHPPYQPSKWSFVAGSLLEFSPIVAGKTLYVIDKDATMFALDATKGKPIWKKDLGSLSASSPAYNAGMVFAVTLAPGQVDALRAKDGKIAWTRPLPGRTETSPIVHGHNVYVGCECGTAYALNKRTGKVDWSVQTGGSIKGGMAFDHGTVFFGNYAGQLYAVDASTGSVKWQASTQGGSFGTAGRIYSTPAVAYGRVYVGSIDSRVYSFEESSGALAWSHSTGAEVYPGPAVADTPGAPPTVFVGSADHHVYALDAKSGALRWEKDVGGIILGAPSVIGQTVYFGVIGPNVGTLGFDTKNGHQVWSHELGEYNPVISDGQDLYLTGTNSMRAFSPLTRAERHRRHQRRVEQEQKRRARHRKQVGHQKHDRPAHAGKKHQAGHP
jgi:outer membrane protein assembly factor BamB